MENVFHMDDISNNTVHSTPLGEVTVDYTVVERIRAAAEEAKRDLAAPPSVMVVKNQAHKTLTVNILDDRLLIYQQIAGNGTSNGMEKLYDEPTDKYRAVLFLYCTDCRIFVMSKVLKLAVMQCSQCQISIRGGVIGPVELFRCADANVDIRSAFPLLTFELCTSVHMYQRMTESVYSIIGASRCTINSVDPVSGQRLASYPIEDLFSTRRFYHLSRNGMRWIEEPYILNNVTPHLIALPPEEEPTEPTDSPFGQTPPTIGFYTYQPTRQNVQLAPGPPSCGWQG